LETNRRKLVHRLEKDGFALVKTVGSHHKFKKGDLTVTVPHHKLELPVGTVHSIYKQAAWV
jgi:predicted RNA binding protein YcfA (HicA-like mRNA interferase family)